MFNLENPNKREYDSVRGGAAWFAKSNPEIITCSLKMFAKDGTQLSFALVPNDKDRMVERKFGKDARNTKEVQEYKAKLPAYNILVNKQVVAAFDATDAEQINELVTQGELA